MKLATIAIDRFGQQSNLHIKDLSPQLNVIFGADQPSQSSIVDFITWVLYGRADNSTGQAGTAASGVEAGSLTVDTKHRRSRITRNQNAAHPAQVRVDDCDNGSSTYGSQLSFSSTVDQAAYQSFFALDFTRPTDIGQLVRAASTRGFALTYDPRRITQIQQLRTQIHRHQQTLKTLPKPAGSLEELKHSQRRRLEQLTGLAALPSRDDQSADLDRRQLNAEISNQRSRLIELGRLTAELDQTIKERRRELDVAIRRVERAEHEWRELRRHKVETIDGQIAQWRQAVNHIRDRLAKLQSQLSSRCSANSTGEYDITDLRLFLESLGIQLHDIDQDLASNLPADHSGLPSQVDSLRSILQIVLQSMRGEVARLCQSIRVRNHAAQQPNDHATELDRLRRCEAELSSLIDHMLRRRQSMLDDHGRAAALRLHPQSLADVDDRALDASHTTSHTVQESPSAIAREGKQDNQSSLDWSTTEPVLRIRLRHLLRRREIVRARIDDANFQIKQCEQQLAALDASQYKIHDGRAETIQRELTQLAARISAAEQRAVIERDIAAAARDLRRLKQSVRPSDVIREASAMLRHISGVYRQLRITDSHEVFVYDRAKQPLAWRQLDRAAQDQAALCLALAVVSAYARRGTRLPIVLKDAFANLDWSRAKSTADLLLKFSQAGHQVVLLTGQKNILPLFSAAGARLYKLKPREQSVDGDQRVDRSVHVKTSRVDESHASPPQRAAFDESSPIEAIPSVRDSLVEKLHSIGVTNVGQFLDLDPNAVQSQLGEFGISAYHIDRWQRETRLQRFAGVTGREAELLVDCGIDGPADLAQLDADELHQRIGRVLETDEGRSRYGLAPEYQPSRLNDWIKSARDSEIRLGARPRRRSRRTGSTKQPRARLEQDATRSTSSGERRASSDREQTDREQTDRGREHASLRFYLDIEDPIVDAPSIGRKTAKRLQTIGVKTVADLLRVDAAAAAGLIKNRNITAKTITDWQSQASLVSGVPNLRVHDAQILVACGVTTCDELARRQPKELWSVVEQVISASAGKRIPRSGHEPDLDEITQWIEWAQLARQTRAA